METPATREQDGRKKEHHPDRPHPNESDRNRRDLAMLHASKRAAGAANTQVIGQIGVSGDTTINVTLVLVLDAEPAREDSHADAWDERKLDDKSEGHCFQNPCVEALAAPPELCALCRDGSKCCNENDEEGSKTLDQQPRTEVGGAVEKFALERDQKWKTVSGK